MGLRKLFKRIKLKSDLKINCALCCSSLQLNFSRNIEKLNHCIANHMGTDHHHLWNDSIHEKYNIFKTLNYCFDVGLRLEEFLELLGNRNRDLVKRQQVKCNLCHIYASNKIRHIFEVHLVCKVFQCKYCEFTLFDFDQPRMLSHCQINHSRRDYTNNIQKYEYHLNSFLTRCFMESPIDSLRKYVFHQSGENSESWVKFVRKPDQDVSVRCESNNSLNDPDYEIKLEEPEPYEEEAPPESPKIIVPDSFDPKLQNSSIEKLIDFRFYKLSTLNFKPEICNWENLMQFYFLIDYCSKLSVEESLNELGEVMNQKSDGPSVGRRKKPKMDQESLIKDQESIKSIDHRYALLSWLPTLLEKIHQEVVIVNATEMCESFSITGEHPTGYIKSECVTGFFDPNCNIVSNEEKIFPAPSCLQNSPRDLKIPASTCNDDNDAIDVIAEIKREPPEDIVEMFVKQESPEEVASGEVKPSKAFCEAQSCQSEEIISEKIGIPEDHSIPFVVSSCQNQDDAIRCYPDPEIPESLQDPRSSIQNQESHQNEVSSSRIGSVIEDVTRRCDNLESLKDQINQMGSASERLNDYIPQGFNVPLTSEIQSTVLDHLISNADQLKRSLVDMNFKDGMEFQKILSQLMRVNQEITDNI